MHRAKTLVALAGTILLLAACSSASTSKPSDTATAPASSSASSPSASIVESLPFNSSGLLGGTAQPSLPNGDPGEVSVVQIGPLDVQRGTLVFAFRNNTSETISHVDWTATARSGGSIVGTGSSQGTIPSWVAPGEVGLAYIYFETAAQIPDGTEYEFAVGSSPADTTSYNTAPLKVTESNLVGTSIVGGATNNTGADATGPFSVSIYCFDGDNLTGETGGFAEQDDAAADAAVSFSVDLYDTVCATYALGVSGYFS